MIHEVTTTQRRNFFLEADPSCLCVVKNHSKPTNNSDFNFMFAKRIAN
jgi:hypothetical protein